MIALDRGLIAGFGFDTLASEPAADGDPMLKALDRPNVIITPHVAWASAEAMQSLWNQAIDQIEKFDRGDAINRVDCPPRPTASASSFRVAVVPCARSARNRPDARLE